MHGVTGVGRLSLSRHFLEVKAFFVDSGMWNVQHELFDRAVRPFTCLATVPLLEFPFTCVKTSNQHGLVGTSSRRGRIDLSLFVFFLRLLSEFVSG